MLFYGHEDRCVGAELMERARLDFAGETEVVAVANAGHFPHPEASEVVAPRVVEWLSRQP